MKALLKRMWRRLFGAKETPEAVQWQPQWSQYLDEKVAFYRVLSDADKGLFNRRVILFLQTTAVEAGQVEIKDEDRLLVAASAIIPVWGFSKCHYFNLEAVYLLPAPFNDQLECGAADSFITGMVGTGPMVGKIALPIEQSFLPFRQSIFLKAPRC